MTHKRGRGRPKLTDEARVIRAAEIIDKATMLRIRPTEYLRTYRPAALALSDQQKAAVLSAARDSLLERQRDPRIRALTREDVAALFPGRNKTAAAVRFAELCLEAGRSKGVAVKWSAQFFDCDERDIRRGLAWAFREGPSNY